MVGKKARPLPTSWAAGTREAPGGQRAGWRASTGGSAEGGLWRKISDDIIFNVFAVMNAYEIMDRTAAQTKPAHDLIRFSF